VADAQSVVDITVWLLRLSSTRLAFPTLLLIHTSGSETIGDCDTGESVKLHCSARKVNGRSLSLHDPVYANHLPFYPFPSNWPIFTPAGKLANFLESYVDVLEVNVWTESTIDPKRTAFNEKTNKWDVTIVRTQNGKSEERTFSVGHIVLATGLGGGQPKMPPPFKGQDQWAGKAVHSSKHTSGSDWKGKRAMVVGACTSAHDVSGACHGRDGAYSSSALCGLRQERRRCYDASAISDVRHVRG